MASNKNVNNKAPRATWLISATILFSLFTFSGLERTIGNSTNLSQTELVAPFNQRNRRTTSFKIFRSRRIQDWLIGIWFRIHPSLLWFAGQIETQFNSNSQVVITFQKSEKVSRLRYAPRNNDTFILPAFRG